jgi:purine-binding chemotaxis protein CheW
VNAACLLVRVDSRTCALPIDFVYEIMRPLPIESLAGMPAFVLGLSVVRGAPVPVVDASRMLGGGVSARPGRFVSVRIGARGAILAVDEVLGVRDVARSSLDALPPLMGEASADLVDAMGTLDAGLLLLLKSSRMVPASVWTTLERENAS